MNTRNYSRLVPGEEIDAVRQWRFDDVDLRGHRLLADALGEVARSAFGHAPGVA